MLNPELYNDIDNAIVRAFNRTMTALAINEEDGAEATAQYLDSFTEHDRKSIGIMLVSYRKNPEETTKYVQGIAYENSN